MQKGELVVIDYDLIQKYTQFLPILMLCGAYMLGIANGRNPATKKWSMMTH